MKKLLALACCAVLCLTPGLVLAGDCVEVDVELTPSAEQGQFAELSLELVNCGPDPALAEMSVWLNTGSPVPVPPLTFFLPIGAGETLSRSWNLPIPPIVPAGTYEICVEATIGEATSSDCASIEITEASGASSRSEATVSAANADDCVEVDVELNPTGTIGEGYITTFDFSVEMTNCGPEPDLAAITVELSGGLGEIPPFTFYLPFGAGETVAHSWSLVLPAALAGTYEVCVSMTIGEATASDCASITIEDNSSSNSSDGGVEVGQNYPNPFNLSTGISFTLEEASDVKFSVHNILGQEVAVLADGMYGPGEHSVTWDARDSKGEIVATGMYLYRLTTRDYAVTKKMMLLK